MKTDNIGIWIDRRQAQIISYKPEDKSGDDQTVEIIESEIEDDRLGKGYGSSVPYAPQDASNEDMLLERKKHQSKRFFDKVADQIKNAKNIYVFGPGEMRKEFKKHLDKNHKQLSGKVVGLDPADNVSENKKKELVRAFFNTPIRKG